MAGFEAYTLPEMIRSVKRGPTCQAPEPATNCNCLLRLPEVRLLQLAEAKDSSAFLREVQQPLQQQLEAEKHRVVQMAAATSHGKRERSLQGWVGDRTIVPIHRVRCCGCGAVNTRAAQLHPPLPQAGQRLFDKAADAIFKYGVGKDTSDHLHLEWHGA